MNTCGLAPLGISLKVMALSGLLLLCIGLPLALALSRPRWFGRRLLETMVSLPLVFPPIAIGFFLLLLLGRQGWVNTLLPETWRFDLVFSFEALLIAATIAGLPLMVKPVQAALEQEARLLAEAASTLGKSAWEIFRHVTCPAFPGRWPPAWPWEWAAAWVKSA